MEYIMNDGERVRELLPTLHTTYYTPLSLSIVRESEKNKKHTRTSEISMSQTIVESS